MRRKEHAGGHVACRNGQAETSSRSNCNNVTQPGGHGRLAEMIVTTPGYYSSVAFQSQTITGHGDGNYIAQSVRHFCSVTPGNHCAVAFEREMIFSTTGNRHDVTQDLAINVDRINRGVLVG